MSDLENLLKKLNSPQIGNEQYLVQFLGLTENFNQIPVIEHVQCHTQTDKIKILMIFGIDKNPSQSEFILPILQSILK